jgi:hypothetical protein
MAEGLHVGHGIGQRGDWVAGGPRRLGGGADVLQRLGQRVRVRGQVGPLHRGLDGAVDAAGHQLQALAAFHHHLAAQQVGRLDAVRALVDHVQALVAPVLLDREVARVAVAAVHLDGQRIGFQAELAGPALGDGRQHLQQQARLVGVFRRARVLLVDQPRAMQHQRQRPRRTPSAPAACA